MKFPLLRFLLSSLCFLSVFACLLFGLDRLSMQPELHPLFAALTDSEDYLDEDAAAAEIVPIIQKAQEEDGTTIAILGDSVCRQMVGDLFVEDTAYSLLPSNGAITLAGQYILTKEYLDHHPDATDIYLFMLPESLERTFDNRWGYQYSVIPFVLTDTLQDLDQETLSIMADTYGSLFLTRDMVESIVRSPINKKVYLNALVQHEAYYEPSRYFELADKYIYMIYDLCKENNVTFHLAPCPVSRARTGSMEQLRGAFYSSEFRRLFPGFFRDMIYVDTEETPDSTHFAGAYANQNHYNELLLRIFGNDPLILSLLGWEHEDGTFRHVPLDGSDPSGWGRLGNDWFYLDDDGFAVSGWFKLDGVWYYFDPRADNRMAIGSVSIDGKNYLFDENGALQEKDRSFNPLEQIDK